MQARGHDRRNRTSVPSSRKAGIRWPRRRGRGARDARPRPPRPRPSVQERGEQVAPPRVARKRSRAAATAAPPPRHPRRPGEAGTAENCVEERARGQLMLDLVSKNGKQRQQNSPFFLPPPLSPC